MYVVSDMFYRASGQLPSYWELAMSGVRNIITLDNSLPIDAPIEETYSTEDLDGLLGKNRVGVWKLGVPKFNPPTDSTVGRCLSIINEAIKHNQKVVINSSAHDSLGIVIAIYRVRECGWSVDDALAEWDAHRKRLVTWWWRLWFKRKLKAEVRGA